MKEPSIRNASWDATTINDNPELALVVGQPQKLTPWAKEMLTPTLAAVKIEKALGNTQVIYVV